MVRRAERHHAPGDVGAAVGHPQPGDDAARRVADDVDALRAGAVQGGVDRVAERVGRLARGRRCRCPAARTTVASRPAAVSRSASGCSDAVDPP